MMSCVLALLLVSPAMGYLETWGLSGGRPTQPTCVDIPRNMSLCHGIGYNKMRLPNLLDHDTMAEVSQQAKSWLALNNIRCHPDTQLFLCSLFSPVCLDRPIYPCRSLCDKVRFGCEGRMKKYGFPWPEMFNCSKFPQDNDMCITPQSGAEERCLVCNQVETYENILDNFCRADFAIRTKIRRAKKTMLKCKKAKVLKGHGELSKQLPHPVLTLEPSDACCEEKTRNSGDFYLIMGHSRGDSKLIPTFIMPWGKNSKSFRKAVRMFKKLNCSDPGQLSYSVIGDAYGGGSTAPSAKINSTGRRKRGRTKGRHKNASPPPAL
ncbi:hypothetical protein L9F63_020817 [Diploptera punctata]|uniref:Secreted frizzled-related protein 5 n=1 Tax=Diploptera punctata TaxID=6984 RepID=A0AAD7ZQQ7_DIPPU|nr:hypothetical protein L9F63_020817 [Diploptera punctata]